MDYQSNSNKKKKSAATKATVSVEKKIEKVIEGAVVQRKKPLGVRFKEVFFGGDFKDASRHIAADVLLPTLRNLLFEASTEGVRRMVYGDSSVRKRPNEMRPKVSYNTPVTRDPRQRTYLPHQPPHPAPSRNSPEQLILASRQEAELVLERLGDIIDQFDTASLADLYDLVGLASSHTDNKWGWSYLTGSEIRQIREGYLLELPPMEAF